jgi:hypothetical protein
VAVRIHYAAEKRALHGDLHGQLGVVRVVARGPGPRNHGLDVGKLVVVPCGNLQGGGR